MKYCTHCGKEIPDEALFCPVCGTATGVSYSAVQQPVKKEELSILSIVGFVFAFIGGLVGLICSCIAYKAAVKEGNEKTKSFSKAGIAVSAVNVGISILFWTLVIVLVFIDATYPDYYPPSYIY